HFDVFFLVFLLRGHVAGQALLEQLRVSQNARERIIYFVGDNSGKFADRSHTLDAQHFFLRALKLARLFFDARFQRPRPGVDFLVRFLELRTHGVEGSGQVLQFTVRWDLDLVAEVARTDALGAFRERGERPLKHAANKGNAE